jgi:phospholipase C
LDFFWPLDDFEDGLYQLRVYGPNGFYREFLGDQQSEGLELGLVPAFRLKEKRSGLLTGSASKVYSVKIKENAYRKLEQSGEISSGKTFSEALDFESSLGWYDFTVEGSGFSWSFAGRLDNGLESISDPLLGAIS